MDLTGHLLNSLKFLYPEFQSNTMKCVEIGSFEGRGSVAIHNYLCKNADSRLFCIDPFNDEYVRGNEKMNFWNYACNGQLNRFRNNILQFPKIIELRGTSDVMIPTLEDKSIDFVYIDGDHSPEQVYKDAVNIFGKMKKNAIVLFDDYLWVMNGVITKIGIDKFLDEYKGKYEILFQNVQLGIRIL